MNPRIVSAAIALVLVLGGVVLGVYAVEADKEVRILCGLFRPGTSEAEMDRILGTANLLRVEETLDESARDLPCESPGGERRVREISSRWNLERNGCRVVLAEEVVVSNQAWERFGGR